MSVKAISLLVIDDNVLVRRAITELVRKHRDFKVLQSSANIDEAVRRARQSQPRVVLLDSTLRDHDSLRITARIRAEVPRARIVVMGVLPHRDEISDFVKAGAHGFIIKHAPFRQFMSTLRTVAGGAHALPRQLTGALFDEIAKYLVSRERGSRLRPLRLTGRERQVVALVSEELSNKQIAARINVSEHTVKSHIHNILEKLALRSRIEIASVMREERVREPR